VILSILIKYNNAFINNIDIYIKNFIDFYRSNSITDLMLSITKIGNITETIIIIAIFGLFLFVKNKNYFSLFIIASSLGITLQESIKLLIQKIRPESITLIEQGFSFPSGHATISTIFLLSSIFLIIPLMKKGFSKSVFTVTVYAVFPLVIISRVYLSVHWFSDMIVGIILGIFCFMIAHIICCHKKENML
jgi:undecaprenyl-diphosphatase